MHHNYYISTTFCKLIINQYIMYSKNYLDLRDFGNILKSKNYSQKTIDCYSVGLRGFLNFTDKPRSHISLVDAEKYIVFIKDFSYNKKNQVISALKLYYKFILNKKLLTNKLERPRKEKKLPKIIDHDYIVECFSKINNVKHKAILTLTYACALRVSEVINLKMKDIDSKRMVIYIRNAKGRKDRVFPISKETLNLLYDYYAKYKPIEYLFNGQHSLKYSANSCNKLVKKYLGEEYHIHLLRHSSATRMYDNGTDIYKIKDLLGHNSTKTTEIYTHLSLSNLQTTKLAI